MCEEELIAIIARNLRPEIRQDLLYVPIRSLSHLRKLVQMRENFLSDEYVRKNLVARNLTPATVCRKYVSPIECDESENCDTSTHLSIEAIQKSEINQKCWNCDKPGHHWHDCIEDRAIFCYGCGAKKIYKPQCAFCLSKSQSKNSKVMSHHKDSIQLVVPNQKTFQILKISPKVLY